MIHVFTPFGILMAGCACALALSFLEHVLLFFVPKELHMSQDLKSGKNLKKDLKHAQQVFLTMTQVKQIVLSKKLCQDQEEQLRLLKNLLK